MSDETNVDINELGLLTQECEVDDVNPEVFFSPQLADDGEHLVTLNLGQRGIKAERQRSGKGGAKTGPPYLGVSLQFKAVKDNGEEGGTVGFDDINTIPMDTNTGKTTRVHMVMAVAGHPIPLRGQLGDWKSAIEQALAQKPQVKVTTKWEAQVKIASAAQASRYGKAIGEYATVCSGQGNFPPLGDNGAHDPEVTEPVSGDKIRARARIVKYAKA